MASQQDKRKIYINGRFLTKNMTGTNRFAYELCLALSRMGVPFTILVPGKVSPFYDISRFNVRKIGHLSSHLWEQISLPLFLLDNEGLLLNFNGLGPVLRKHQLSAIHDLSFLENPAWFSKLYYWYYKLMTPVMARKAKKILTVSEFSKNEIMEKLGIQSDKIVVTYNGVPFFCQTEPAIHGAEIKKIMEIPYILTVSSLDPRKNIAAVIKAFQLLDMDEHLYIIGENNRIFSPFHVPEFSSRIHFLGRVSDERLYHYYANASLFVYPSLYEGFGLPPLEALVCGCPRVLLSDIPVFREIYGDYVSYVQYDSPQSIAEGMEKVLQKEPLKRDVKELMSRFSWEKSAAKIYKVIGE